MPRKPLDEFKDHTGAFRPLGHKPPRKPVLMAPPLGDVMPESAWVEFEIEPEAAFLDQDGKGACNGHAAVTTEEIARWVAGMPHIPLSPWYVYAILCNGIDRGSNIGQALELMRDKGAPPFDAVPYGTINPRKLSKESHDLAGRFKIEIGQMLTTPAELMTAVQRRQPFNFSVAVAAGFDDLDADGCVRLGRGYDNHAVCGTACGAKRCRDGGWAFKWRNSWSRKWGIDGEAWMRLDRVARNTYFEGYSISAVTSDPSGDEPPPVLA
jgi:hypothetical protein